MSELFELGAVAKADRLQKRDRWKPETSFISAEYGCTVFKSHTVI
jgi:hypothetical protein